MTRFLYLLLFCVVCTQASAQFGTLTKVPVSSRGNVYGYVEYLPPNYDASGAKKYPVLYWLHGNGSNETGGGTSTTLDKLYNRTIAQWLKTQSIEFIVLIPQDAGGWFGNLASFVNWANTYYQNAVNLNQQHLAGLSAGGYAMRDFINGNSDAYKGFATFTPMSTNWDGVINVVPRFAANNQYVWIHHGTADTTPNDLPTVTRFHNAMYANPATQSRSRVTAYEGLGHSAWEEVYDASGKGKTQRTGLVPQSQGATFYAWTNTDPDVDWFGWMLSHGKVPVVPPTPPVVKVGVLIPSSATSFKIMGNVTDDGTITTHQWQKVSGPDATLGNATTPVLTVTNFAVGTYVFRLTATDNTNSQAAQEVTVYVEAAAQASAQSATEALPTEKENNTAMALLKGELPSDTQVVVFTTDQARVYDGAWTNGKYQEVFKTNGLYIYHVVKDGKRTTGKIYIK